MSRSCLLLLAACTHGAGATSRAALHPLELTYLGVAGWQIEGDGHVILADPYFSRPASFDAPIVPDAAAIAAHVPAHAELVVVGHSHVDHLLDAPAVALKTGAQLLGSASTINVARASGVADDHLIGIRGGEDLAFEGFSVRVIPSLHSMIGVPPHVIPENPTLPMAMDGYGEGGTFAYLLRLAGREILVFNTANFIERELVGVHPEIAIIAPGGREKIHDYTCRLLHVLGDPPIVIATHFDDWRHAPADPPPDADLEAFVAEINRCSPLTRAIIPRHFEKFAL